MPTVLTIAGFDPSSGAGITADLMVFAAHGLFATSAITALTVQSTTGVRATHPVAPEVLADTLACLHADLPPTGVKIGMLGTAANVLVVAHYIEELRRTNASATVVLDPVIRSSSGRELLDPEGLTAMTQKLLPLVDWVTPNLAELAALTGMPVTDRADLPPACRALQVNTPGGRLGILATGGHLNPPDDFLRTSVGEEAWLPGVRIETRATHGTGCALSSAFLSRLILSDTPAQAAAAAKSHVSSALRFATSRGGGRSGFNNLWRFANLDDEDKAASHSKLSK